MNCTVGTLKKTYSISMTKIKMDKTQPKTRLAQNYKRMISSKRKIITTT